MPDSESCRVALPGVLSPSDDNAGPANDDFNGNEIGLLEALRDYIRPIRPACPEPSEPFVQDYGHFRTLQFDRLHLQSEMDLRDPVRLTIDYTRVMMGFLFFVPRPRRIEMIGLGGGSLAKYCHYALPDADITVVEINPEVIALRDRFLIPPDSDRFRVVQGDGADFVQRDEARPDVILVDGFDAFGQPPQLCSAPFYQACQRRMAPDGMMVVNIWGTYKERLCFAARIHHAFEGRTLGVPTESGTNRAVFAGKAHDPMLSRGDLAEMMPMLGERHGPFLGCIGRRIVRCVEKLERRRQARPSILLATSPTIAAVSPGQ
ncbi:fused MFS/spermidine synthase [Sphingomonas oryzagri]